MVWDARFANKIAFVGEGDAEIFREAKTSLHILLPKFIELLHRSLHERYSMNASQSGTKLFYFFQASDPIDAFSLHLSVRGGRAFLALGYVPYGLTSGKPDYGRAVEEQSEVDDPELAGLTLMRMARKLLTRI